MISCRELHIQSISYIVLVLLHVVAIQYLCDGMVGHAPIQFCKHSELKNAKVDSRLRSLCSTWQQLQQDESSQKRAMSAAILHSCFELFYERININLNYRSPTYSLTKKHTNS